MIASTIDAQGRSWASLLKGKADFIEVVSETEVAIAPSFIEVDLAKRESSIVVAFGRSIKPCQPFINVSSTKGQKTKNSVIF